MTLVAFDFDGTLSDSEMTVLLGERCDCADEMAAITERAMAGELGYAESLRERVALLADLPLSEAEVAFEHVVLREGAADLLRALNEAGHTTAILTGGFARGVERALEWEGVSVDAIVSNRLVDDGERLTGEVEGPLIEGTKDDALADLADAHGVDRHETVAVGDGANDLPMLQAAGLAVGFLPKPSVDHACDVVVEEFGELRALFETEGLLSPAGERTR